MTSRRSKGFTLTEMMMAIVISIIIFSAMATLLSRCFSLWLNAQAQWKLAQHARVTRLQILNGAFGIGTGILSSKNVTVGPYGSWEAVYFDPVSDGQTYCVVGWPGDSQQNVWIRRMADAGDWRWAQTVSQAGYSDVPNVLVNNFDAMITNQVITLSYTLNFRAMGQNFELPQMIEAHLVNDD